MRGALVFLLAFFHLSVVAATAWLAARKYRNPAWWLLVALYANVVALAAVASLPEAEPIRRFHGRYGPERTPTVATLVFWIVASAALAAGIAASGALFPHPLAKS